LTAAGIVIAGDGEFLAITHARTRCASMPRLMIAMATASARFCDN
jgi:hypothetical protein